MELPQIVKIKKIVNENKNIKTFFIDKKIKCKPGQFFMVWLPGVDEKPFVLSYTGSKTGFTVEKKGRFTKAMFKLKSGAKIGIRGPYGNGFTIRRNACVIAGGLGAAPLLPLIEKLEKPVVILAARTKSLLLFEKEIKEPNVCTDDCSKGFGGFATELFEKILQKRNFSIVYAVGPEIMAKKVFEICEKHKIDCEISLERYMYCGLGVCGSCVCGDRLVCKDGPVFNSKELRKMDEFGKYAYLKSGKKVKLKEYYEWRS